MLLLSAEQKALLLNEPTGARLFRIEHIDPEKRQHDRPGVRHGWSTRVEILRIPSDTKIDGLSVAELHEKLEDRYAAQRAAAAALRRLLQQQQRAGGTDEEGPVPKEFRRSSEGVPKERGKATTWQSHNVAKPQRCFATPQRITSAPVARAGIPLAQRSPKENLGNFSFSLRQLRANGSTRKYVYRTSDVLELSWDFIVEFINEVKSLRAWRDRLDWQCFDEVSDVFDDDTGEIERLQGEELARAWSMFGKISKIEPGRYFIMLRFPSVMTRGPTARRFVELEMNVAQFAVGHGIDDNPYVRAVKVADGTMTRDYSQLRRGPGSFLLDNVPSSFSRSRVRELNRSRPWTWSFG